MDINALIRKKFRVKRITALPLMGMRTSSRKDLYSIFNEAGYKRGAEIGVWTGNNAKSLLMAVNGLDLILVDPWRGGYRNGASDELLEECLSRCKRRLRHWNPTYMRMASLDAVDKIQDESLDFVYIDGLHDFDNVMLDLISWVPKVRSGGMVAGHDFFYGYEGDVIQAVTAYTQAHNIFQWYITGGIKPFKGKANEPPSFFWVKQ